MFAPSSDNARCSAGVFVQSLDNARRSSGVYVQSNGIGCCSSIFADPEFDGLAREIVDPQSVEHDAVIGGADLDMSRRRIANRNLLY